jgi:transposase
MKRALVSQKLWRELEPLVPKAARSPKGGRPPLSDRAAFNGILFVLFTGIPWEELPQELGWGSGMTCWRRLRHWQKAGVWDKLHHTLLNRLRQYDQIDWHRASIDAASVASPRGVRRRAPTPPTAASSAASAM